MHLIYAAIPLFILTMLVEARALAGDGRYRGYVWRDTATSLSLGLAFLLVSGVVKLATLPLYHWLHGWSPWDLRSHPQWGIPALVVLEDLCFYAYHRAAHEVRLLWAAHVNHHSSEHYNLSTALRQSWTSPLLGWVFWVPLPLLGFPVEWIATQQAISLLYQYWIHTEKIGTLGPFELIFNTPSHHRVHHGSNQAYLDTNYGGILIVWDRLFGTFKAEDERAVFGILHNLGTYRPWVVGFHEWVAIFRDLGQRRGLRAWFGTLFARPGWQPDGPGETVPELRNRAAQQMMSRTTTGIDP